MSEIRDRAREKIAIALWLSNNTLTEEEYTITSSWWKTLNFDTKKKHPQKANQILSIPELAEGLELLEKGYNAKVDREAKLPTFSFSEEPPNMRFGYQLAQQEILKNKWVKEITE